MSAARVPGEQVTFYSGNTYAQRPVSFTWNEQEFQVDKVIAEWKTPDGKCFLVQTTDGQEFKIVLESDH